MWIIKLMFDLSDDWYKKLFLIFLIAGLANLVWVSVNKTFLTQAGLELRGESGGGGGV